MATTHLSGPLVVGGVTVATAGALTGTSVSANSYIQTTTNSVTSTTDIVTELLTTTVITSTQLQALNTTPITIVPAAPTGYANVLIGIIYTKAAGTAYTSLHNCTVNYTSGSGVEAGPRLTAVGFFDQTTIQSRYVFGCAGGSVGSTGDITPTAAAPIVLSQLTGNMATGTGSLTVCAQYLTIPIPVV
jgi:hypothetical protein